MFDLCCDRPVTSPSAHADPTSLRAVAEQLAAEAATFARQRRTEVFGAHPQTGAVRAKSTPTDPVTVVDTETERLLRDRLAQLRPGDPVVGEEEGGPAAEVSADAVTWVLDPIDGTVNFVYGLPAYAVSVAARVGGVSVAGAVANISTGELYSAGLGLGAQVRDGEDRRELRCSAVSDLSMALVGTGFGYSPQLRAAQAELLARLLPTVRDIRRIGSAALDLCLVAAGQLDAHYEHGLNVWDWAAGALIAAEAGAQVYWPRDDESGASLLMVAAPGIAEQLRDALDSSGGLAALP